MPPKRPRPPGCQSPVHGGTLRQSVFPAAARERGNGRWPIVLCPCRPRSPPSEIGHVSREPSSVHVSPRIILASPKYLRSWTAAGTSSSAPSGRGGSVAAASSLRFNSRFLQDLSILRAIAPEHVVERLDRTRHDLEAGIGESPAGVGLREHGRKLPVQTCNDVARRGGGRHHPMKGDELEARNRLRHRRQIG